MKTSSHPFNFDVRAAFPTAREIDAWEGGCAYVAERDGALFVITDSGTMADFLDADDADLADCLVRVHEFETEDERRQFLKRRAGVRFDPWVGSGYVPRAGLLVLGESHYGGAHEAEESGLTNRVVQDYVDQRWTHRFWTQVARTVSGTRLDRDACSAFWRGTAFYNFVQDLAGDGARQRPTDSMWRSARRPFLYVLDELSPRVVLVCGKELWCRLPDAERTSIHLADGRTWSGAIYRTRGGADVLAAYINHPASRGFSSRKWSSVATALMGAVAP